MAENATGPQHELEDGTHQQILRALADAYAEEAAVHERQKELWALAERRGITTSEYGAFLQKDQRIEWAHEATWNKRKNRLLGRPTYRDKGFTGQRRGRGRGR